MDYFLAVSTLLVNGGLGWSKGAWWMWCLHGLNAALWIGYSYQIGQIGFVWLSIATLAVDVVSAFRAAPRRNVLEP